MIIIAMSVNVPFVSSTSKSIRQITHLRLKGKRRPLFPSYYFARTLIAAAIVSALISVPLRPLMAAPASYKAVQVERLGYAEALDDSARPAANANIHLTFALNSTAADGIADFVNSLTDPKSPNYHHWITASEFGQKFGAASSDIAAVKQYLASQGFSNIKVYSNNLFVTADTSRTSAETAFNVTIHGYDRSADLIAKGYSPTYYAPDAEPTVDAAIADKLHGIFGLSNAMQKVADIVHPSATPNVYTAGNPLNPSDLTTAYDISALHTAGDYGKGMTIAIFSPTTYTASDVTTFFTNNTIAPIPTIDIVNVNGGATDDLASDEACLDIETIGGQANESTIRVYEGPNDGSFDIFNQVATDDATIPIQVLSESYGTDETTVDAAYATSYDIVRSQLSSEGITIFVASGDTGAYADSDAFFGTGSTASVSVDASSQYVTGVGGTELTLTSASAWSSELAWTFNDQPTTLPDGGSNGGLSLFYSIPSWQTGVGVDKTGISNGMREVPDVSALGGLPGYNIYCTSFGNTAGVETVEGTSGSCPLWASAILLIDEALGDTKTGQGNINPSLYSYAQGASPAFHDIISGNNGVYNCTTGYDLVTGLGSADFGELLNYFKGTATSAGTHSFGPGLQMITIPYSYAANTFPQILSGLVTSAGAISNEVAAWDNDTDSYSVTPTPPANTPVLGQGYWARFNSTAGGSLVFNGTPTSALAFGVELSPGWNMIGDPFTSASPLPISSSLEYTSSGGTQSFGAAAASGLISSTLYGYNPSTSTYSAITTANSLLPWTGYWVYANTGGELTFLAP
jgi:kumamolisin